MSARARQLKEEVRFLDALDELSGGGAGGEGGTGPAAPRAAQDMLRTKGGRLSACWKEAARAANCHHSRCAASVATWRWEWLVVGTVWSLRL